MADPKPVTVYHPAFADVSQEVSATDADQWVEAGWRKTPHKAK